ncbi:MAG: hypothetical protein H6741_23320 [Alphaproteobacteria bacterium]|nr:hypothetical protein [Alphaproteobacteria bacterium]
MRSFSEAVLPGPLLAAAASPGLHYACLKDLEVIREGGVSAGPWAPEAELHLAGPLTWRVSGDRAEAWREGRCVATHAVDTRTDGPAFAAAPGVAVTLRGDHLIELHSGLLLGSALAGQTRLFCGGELGYGVYRPGRMTVHFTFNPRRPGLFTAQLPPFEGRLLELDACFDGGRALIASLTESRGRRRAALWLIDARGRLLAAREGDPEADPLLVGARTLRGEVVVVADPSGLHALRPHAGRLETARHFPDAAPLIDPSAALLPGPGGSLYTLTPREIRRISLH